MIASNGRGLGERRWDKEKIRRVELVMPQAETPPTEPRHPDAMYVS